MTTQTQKREQSVKHILDSQSNKKLIVAGPGTGKTFTFKQILNNFGPGNHLILSFIRKLVDELAIEIGDAAEVKTFHAFCKRILHEKQGKVDIYPKLPEIIQKDAELFGYKYSDFESKFRNLEETAPEISFFLKRGDYYDYLSFDDSVYRLYKLLKDDDTILDEYDQIIVDEYQDFNKLEVEFLKELENKGSILIAGDDDQAIYSGRSSTPDFLRDIYNSGEYEIFELPYCSRCPEVVVKATNQFIAKVIELGGFEERINKHYLPFTEGKEELNQKYSKIKVVTVPVISTIAKYIDIQIQKIPTPEIIESNNAGSSYPTVLIIGQKHYLSELQKILIKKYPQVEFDDKSDEINNKILDGIKILLKDINANLGWRIIAAELISTIALKAAVIESKNSTLFKEILDKEFVQSIIEIVKIIKKVKNEKRDFSVKEMRFIREIFYADAKVILSYFSPKEDKIENEQDNESPTILLRTFEGSKGLSGGHVFIVSANNGSMPKIIDGEISDIECCKFIVALTRTRKQCHIISNKWLISPKNKEGKWAKKFERSGFIDFISGKLKDDLGDKNSTEIN